MEGRPILRPIGTLRTAVSRGTRPNVRKPNSPSCTVMTVRSSQRCAARLRPREFALPWRVRIGTRVCHTCSLPLEGGLAERESAHAAMLAGGLADRDRRCDLVCASAGRLRPAGKRLYELYHAFRRSCHLRFALRT